MTGRKSAAREQAPYGGMTYRQISDILKIPPGTVKSIETRAIKKLLALIEDKKMQLKEFIA